MSAVAPETHPANMLIKLCREGQWQQAIEHVRARPNDVKAASVAGRGSLPPLHVACENGAPIQVIKVLLNSHPPAAQTKSGLHERLPLHCLLNAAPSHPLLDSIVTVLVEAYPGACRVADCKGNLPIHLACQATNVVSDGIFTSILSMYPEGAYARNISGNYPLHIAASNKNLKTRKTALAALDRGTLYASISKMTSFRLSKEYEIRTKSLEKGQADKLNKVEGLVKSLQTQLEQGRDEKVQHQENMSLAVQKEQSKASKMEKELRSELAEVQLKNMDFLDQIEEVQSGLEQSNEKADKQAKEIKGLQNNLNDSTRMYEETKLALENTGKELHETREQLTSARCINEDKSKYIDHLEASLRNARQSILDLVTEQERMNVHMSSQKEAVAALLLGHDTAMNDAGALVERMVGLAVNIEQVTTKEGSSDDADAKEDDVKEE